MRTKFDLDESFLLLTGKTTEAIEAFAFTVAVVKAAVGAGGKLGEVAEVVVVVDLSNGTCDSTCEACRDGVGTSARSGGVDFEEVLDTGLTGRVSELNSYANFVSGNGVRIPIFFAEVGGASGVFEVAIGALTVCGDVLNTIVEAVAQCLTTNGGRLDLDAQKNSVGKCQELILDKLSVTDVAISGTSIYGGDGVGGPLSAVGVVVIQEELVTGSCARQYD